MRREVPLLRYVNENSFPNENVTIYATCVNISFMSIALFLLTTSSCFHKRLRINRRYCAKKLLRIEGRSNCKRDNAECKIARSGDYHVNDKSDEA